MELDGYLDALTADGKAFAVAAERDLNAPVTACPGWSTARLVGHTGRIHRWVAEMVRVGALERIDRAEMPAAPGHEALVPWFREGVAGLIDTLRAADPDMPVWSWASPKSAAFWFRRMAQETAVHRWDAERATSSPEPIGSDLAADGVDELLDIFVPTARPGPGRPGGRIHLRATDGDRMWDLAVTGPDTTAAGTASNLLLFLWSRIEPGALDITGDEASLQRWQDEVRI